MPLTYTLLFTYPYNSCYSVFAPPRIYMKMQENRQLLVYLLSRTDYCNSLGRSLEKPSRVRGRCSRSLRHSYIYCRRAHIVAGDNICRHSRHILSLDGTYCLRRQYMPQQFVCLHRKGGRGLGGGGNNPYSKALCLSVCLSVSVSLSRTLLCHVSFTSYNILLHHIYYTSLSCQKISKHWTKGDEWFSSQSRLCFSFFAV